MDDATIQVDVAIVGGGPGGLATAAAVLAASEGRLSVKVSSRVLLALRLSSLITRSHVCEMCMPRIAVYSR